MKSTLLEALNACTHVVCEQVKQDAFHHSGNTVVLWTSPQGNSVFDANTEIEIDRFGKARVRDRVGRSVEMTFRVDRALCAHDFLKPN